MATITIEDDCEETADAVEAELLKALGSKLPQSRNSRFIIAARDEQTRLLGGLTASTSYGWMSVESYPERE